MASLRACALVLLAAGCSTPSGGPYGECPMPFYREGVVEEVREFVVTNYGGGAPAWGGGGVSVGVAGGTGGRTSGGIGIGIGFPLFGFGGASAPSATRVYDITVKLDSGEMIIVRQPAAEPRPAKDQRVRVVTENGVTYTAPLPSPPPPPPPSPQPPSP